MTVELSTGRPPYSGKGDLAQSHVRTVMRREAISSTRFVMGEVLMAKGADIRLVAA